MDSNELISVIVPVFRTEKMLRRCVSSILSQSLQNFEVILVDDGSDDASPELCDELAESDSRISVIHKPNGGLSSARNAGLNAAKGEYISFIDSDDYIAPDFLELLYTALKNNSADIAKIDYMEVSGSDAVAKRRNAAVQLFTGDQAETAYLDLKVDSVCVFLYTREIIGDTRFIEGATSEDIPFNFEIFRKTSRFAYLPEQVYFYYQNPDSISNGKLDKNMFNYLRFRGDIYRYYAELGDGHRSSTAESLYARAAMGLMLRMSLYGLSDDLDEAQCKKQFREVFVPHRKSFYRNPGIPKSRKIAAFAVFHFYPLVKVFRGLKL